MRLVYLLGFDVFSLRVLGVSYVLCMCRVARGFHSFGRWNVGTSWEGRVL